MKVKYLILATISLLFTCAKAQSYETIKLYEGTDSAVSISLFKDDVWITTNDSLIIMRRDVFEIGDLYKEAGSNKNSKRSLEEIRTFSGKIVRWRYGRNYKYDGFYLQTGEDTLFVDFHANLAAQLRALDENVEVSGVIPKYSNPKHPMVRMVRVNDGKDTIYANMILVFPKIHYSKENAIKGSGTIIQLSDKHNGRLESCLLDNNVILDLHYFAPRSLCGKLKKGVFIEYTAEEELLREGEVSAKDYKILHCFTITINGKEYPVSSDAWKIDAIKL